MTLNTCTEVLLMCQSFVSVILVVHVSVRWSTTDKPLDSPCPALLYTCESKEEFLFRSGVKESLVSHIL